MALRKQKSFKFNRENQKTFLKFKWQGCRLERMYIFLSMKFQAILVKFAFFVNILRIC